jgi:hypothetical protein
VAAQGTSGLAWAGPRIKAARGQGVAVARFAVACIAARPRTSGRKVPRRALRGPPALSRRRRPQIHPHRTCPSAQVYSHLTTCTPPASSRVLAHRISQLSADFHICLLCLCSYRCMSSALNTVCQCATFYIILLACHIPTCGVD